jgi:hypothetical protein
VRGLNDASEGGEEPLAWQVQLGRISPACKRRRDPRKRFAMAAEEEFGHRTQIRYET